MRIEEYIYIYISMPNMLIHMLCLSHWKALHCIAPPRVSSLLHLSSLILYTPCV